MPGVLDRYLAKTGFSAQQTDHPRDPTAPTNLWEPADGTDGRDYGARGSFDSKAHSQDPQLWMSQHHGLLGAGLVGLGMLTRAVANRVTTTRGRNRRR